MEIYYLANGKYPADSVTDLDISISGCTITGAGKVLCDGYCFNYTGGIPAYPNAMIVAMIEPENCDLEYSSRTFIKWYLDNTSTPNKRVCKSKVSGVCKSLAGFAEE